MKRNLLLNQQNLVIEQNQVKILAAYPPSLPSPKDGSGKLGVQGNPGERNWSSPSSVSQALQERCR
jgi:hypothetical protein